MVRIVTKTAPRKVRVKMIFRRMAALQDAIRSARYFPMDDIDDFGPVDNISAVEDISRFAFKENPMGPISLRAHELMKCVVHNPGMDDSIVKEAWNLLHVRDTMES